MTAKSLIILGHALYGIFLKHHVNYHHACINSLEEKKQKQKQNTTK